MPRGEMTEESVWRFEEDTPYQARLDKVEERHAEGTRPDGTKWELDRWQWQFKITEDCEQYALSARVETPPKFSTREDNMAPLIVEALRGTPIELGESVDTDDLIGLECRVVIKHGEPRPKKDGTMFYPENICEVYPLEESGSAPQSGRPPF